ncbi:hypothetical protein, partial [uncultured Lamprocystis sp.]|uniref:hypothetical protein n=1 Tax=uncultured Lamprocystis sp. TaxID=543132 RepID=UPI0025D051CC
LEIAKKRHQANPVVLSFAAYNLFQQFVRIINKVSITFLTPKTKTTQLVQITIDDQVSGLVLLDSIPSWCPDAG